MIVMFMSSFLSIVDALLVLIIFFLVSHDHDVRPLLVLLMHSLYQLSFSYSMVVVMCMSFSLDATNAFLVLMVIFLVNCDHDVHELFS
jgi:hypothetical protein